MSLLAERKRKQRISVDPQNKRWKNDSEKLGQKLMEKMGWSEGRGLGAQEQGRPDTIKLKPNVDSKGLGCHSQADETWMGHHDDFSDLLAKLNKKKKLKTSSQDDEQQTSADAESLETKSRQSKTRIHYQKFTRGKDLSKYTNDEKSALLGGRKKRKNRSQSMEKKDTSEGIAEGNTVTSTLSVNDYFASKMQKIKQKLKEQT